MTEPAVQEEKPPTRIVRTFVADSRFKGDVTPHLEIRCELTVPGSNPKETVTVTLDSQRRTYQHSADEIVEALVESAPGGLVDALLGALLETRASYLRVPFGPASVAVAEEDRSTTGKPWNVELSGARHGAIKHERRDVVVYLLDTGRSYGNPGGPIEHAFKEAAAAIAEGFHSRDRATNLGEDFELGAIREAEDRGAFIEAKQTINHLETHRNTTGIWVVRDRLEQIISELRGGEHRAKIASAPGIDRPVAHPNPRCEVSPLSFPDKPVVPKGDAEFEMHPNPGGPIDTALRDAAEAISRGVHRASDGHPYHFEPMPPSVEFVPYPGVLCEFSDPTIPIIKAHPIVGELVEVPTMAPAGEARERQQQERDEAEIAARNPETETALKERADVLLYLVDALDGVQSAKIQRFVCDLAIAILPGKHKGAASE